MERALVEPPAAPGADALRVFAVALETLRQELLACAGRLAPLVPGNALGFADSARDTLQALSCRIAVIGQVKAGKSSFVNALIRRPEFLPTDINPWTTAVTRLNFGITGGPPGVAMAFRFFDAAEWERLQNGSGSVRQLTERLVPGFETELLRRNIEAIRRRAVERIGADFDSLLGQVHTYEGYSDEILQSYICAGRSDGDGGGGNSELKHYSDIIQSADIYFPQSDNQFPTTVIDTPGTNDPFMVRDEITRRALEAADVYIIVIMARQALSNADVALLRILRGLHKDRIVVFINRIDELGDIVEMTPRVVAHVRAGLEREFPGSDIPVVAGSALWANSATTGDADLSRTLLTADARAYAAQVCGARPPVEVNGGHAPAATLMRCSGLPELFRVLNENIEGARPGHLIRQVAASLHELARLSLADLTRERAMMAPPTPATAFDEAAFETLRNEIAGDARRAERLLEALEWLLVDLDARFTHVVSIASDELYKALRGDLLRYRIQECERLMDALVRGASVARWRAETGGIRRVFEESVLAHFRAAEQHFVFLATAVCEQLERLLEEWSPDTPARIGEGETGRTEPPSVIALGQFIVLDLHEPFWRRWCLMRQSPDERVDQLDELIIDAFGGIVDDLAVAFEARLEELRGRLDQRLSLYHALIVAAVERRSRQALARLHAMERERDAWAAGEAQRANEDDHAAELGVRIAELEALVAVLEGFCERLSAPKEGAALQAANRWMGAGSDGS